MSSLLGDYNDSAMHTANLSYTEDKILIYTLYISNFAPEVDEEKLRTYCETFGTVSNLNIQSRTDENEKTFRFGFVTFDEPESASQALRHPTNSLRVPKRDRICYLRPADSWKQPYLNKRYQIPGYENIEEEENDNPSILNLPDDILFLIFQHLALNEQVKLSTLCIRFQQIFKKLYKVKQSVDIDLVQGLTLMDFRIFLQEAGEYLHRIKLHSSFPVKNFTRFIVFISELCKNLIHLQLHSLNFKYINVFRIISQNFKTIQTLELPNCGITNTMMNLISKMTTIQELDLTKNFALNGQYLFELPNLKRLILNECVKIRPKYFVQMCKKTKKLQTLNIRHCDYLNFLAFETMVVHLKDLNTLTMCTCYSTVEIDQLAELESLKHLTINVSIVQPDKLLQKLSELKSEQLETLIVTNYLKTLEREYMITQFKNIKCIELPFVQDLHGIFLRKLSQLKHLKILSIPGCMKVTELDLLEFIKITSNIEQIDISRTKITNNFIHQVCDVFREMIRPAPVTLIVGKTLITKSIRNDPKLIEHRKKLKLLFKTTKYNVAGYEDDLDDEDRY